MTHRLYFFFCLYLVSFITAVAQDSLVDADNASIVQRERYEQKHKNSDANFSLISLKEKGLVLVREKEKYKGSRRLWELIVLDTTLQEKNNVEFDVEQRHGLIGYEVAPSQLYLLYRMGETNRNALELIEFSLDSAKETQRFEIKPELDFRITHFNKAGRSMVLGGYVSNDPAILLYDLESKSIKVVPGFFQKDNELVDLRTNQNNTFNTVLIDRSLRNERKLVFKTFDESGKMLLDDVVPIEEDRSLQTSISSSLYREELMILGTWGDKQGKQSVGFFSLNIDPFSEQKIRYYHFGQLNHFLDYLNPKRAERIKSSTQNDVEAGRKPSFSAYVVPFKIHETNNGFFLMAEVYNPVSSVNPYYSTPYGNPYANPYFYGNPFFPGFYPGMRMYRPYSFGNNVKDADQIKTYEAVLAGFNSKGELVWDYSMKLNEIERPTLEQVSDYYLTNSRLIFLYKTESDIKVKDVNLETHEMKESSQKVVLSDPLDEIRNENKSEDGLKHWYGDKFYTWGYQTIRNINRKDDRVRDVFYINKIAIR